MAERMFIIDQLPNVSPETQKFFEDIADYVVPILERGRFLDLEQTCASIYWAKLLCIHEDIDPIILLPSVYFHHTGYYGIRDRNTDSPIRNEKIRDWNDYHMKESAGIANAFLCYHRFQNKMSEFQKYQIVFSIMHHDKLENVPSIKQNISLNSLIEADTLGQMDFERGRLPPGKYNLRQYISKELILRRWPLFTTEFGKKTFKQLFGELYNHYKNM